MTSVYCIRFGGASQSEQRSLWLWINQKERELTYYTCNSYSRINLNTSGWYLAHILPVGYNFAGKQRLTEVFPNPKKSGVGIGLGHIRTSAVHLRRMNTLYL